MDSSSKSIEPSRSAQATEPAFTQDSSGNCLAISPSLKIPLQELQFDCSRASGPGGQHVNTTDSAVQLRFNIRCSKAIPEEIRERLYRIAGGKINSRGELLIDIKEFRSQARNRQKALRELKEILARAEQKPKRRKKTSVPSASKKNRLLAKKHQAVRRKNRQIPQDGQ